VSDVTYSKAKIVGIAQTVPSPEGSRDLKVPSLMFSRIGHGVQWWKRHDSDQAGGAHLVPKKERGEDNYTTSPGTLARVGDGEIGNQGK
jgi:hypothetical protein